MKNGIKNRDNKYFIVILYKQTYYYQHKLELVQQLLTFSKNKDLV